MKGEPRPAAGAMALLGRARRAAALDRRGAAAVIIAMMMPVMVAGLAMAVDSFNNRIVFARLQAAADAAALDGLEAHAAVGSATAAALAAARANLPDTFGNSISAADIEEGQFTAEGVFIPGAGPDVNAVRVRAFRTTTRGNAVRQIVAGFFGRPFADVSTTAIAARPLNTFYEPPEAMNLDNEAGDFNELYAYCFDYAGSGPAASRRSKMTLIANNLPVGTNVATFTSGVITQTPNPIDNWPRCDGESESLSFRLRNIRHAKSHRVLWSNPGARVENRNPGRPEFNYFTDTVITAGVESFSPSINMLETVRCDTREQCIPGQPGSIVPRGRNRMPQRSITPCEPGKFMYFGWEDRPPGQSGAASHWMDPAWTDRDFDDIVILMRCPRSGRLGESKVRLVR